MRAESEGASLSVLTSGGRSVLISLLADYVLEQGTIRDTVEASVFGADGDRGVPELLYGALDAVYGDHVSHRGAVLDVAAGCYVAREQGEPLAQGEGGDEASGAEDDNGYDHEDVRLEAQLRGGEQRGDGYYGGEDGAPEAVRA